MSDAHFRRSARSPVDLKVQFRRDEMGAELEKAGRVSDLSMGGLFIACASVPPVGSRLRLLFSLPTAWEPLELPAEVKWARGDGFGAEFRRLAPLQAEALYELLSRLDFEESA